MIEEQYINFEFILRYIRSLVTEDVTKLYDFAMDKDIPVAKPETTKLLYLLAMIKQPKKVLELGTGIGCSAVILSKAIGEDATIVTVEKNPDNYEEACRLFQENGLEKRIFPKNGDGMDVLKELEASGETFDFIFLDSAKGQYYDYLPYLKKMLLKGGVLVTDNVLYKGMVANDDLLILRKKTIVKRLRMYLDAISHDEELESVVIPIGDGISLTVKK